MFFASRLPAALVGAAALTLAVPIATRALSATEVNKIAKETTVHIDSQTPGSGVIIKKNGETYTVLTAAHVVATEDNYQITTADGQIYPVKTAKIQRLKGVDLATVQFSSDLNYRTAQTGDASTASEGTLSYVAGFPLQTQAITASLYTFTEGKVTANATRPLADGYSLVYSNRTLPGMSGGPVLDANGSLIGIHGRADTTEQPQDHTGNPDIYLKTGFNLGITINTFQRLTSGDQEPQVAPGPLTADDFFLQGKQQFKEKNNKAAYASFNQAIDANPRYANAYIGRGYTKYLDKYFDGAIADYSQAINLDPQLMIAYHRRAEVKRAQKNYQGAILDFTQAIQLDPRSGNYYARAITRYVMADDRGAILDFDQAIQLNPSNASTYYNRGAAKDNLKDYQGALADYNRAIRLQPKFPYAYLKRATVRARSKDFKGALADLELSVQSDPNYADAYRDRALMKRFFGDIKGAIADYRKAAQLYQEQGNRQQYQNAVNELNSLR